MAAYQVTGTISPDATTAHTGQPAGTYNGQPYWTWTNDAGTWYLWYRLDLHIGDKWYISQSLNATETAWSKEGGVVVGDYTSTGGFPSSTGTATVAVITPGKIRMKMADVTMRREKF